MRLAFLRGICDNIQSHAHAHKAMSIENTGVQSHAGESICLSETMEYGQARGHRAGGIFRRCGLNSTSAIIVELWETGSASAGSSSCKSWDPWGRGTARSTVL